jgi:hypothetical protein
MVWAGVPLSPDGSFPIAQGARYAVLASVTRNYSLAEVASYLNGHGWQTTYAWEEGSPTRGLYAIDTWLASLAADATNNHRWVYGEANRTGASESLGAHAPWPFTFYAIAHVFRAVPAPPGQTPGPPELPPPSENAPPAATVPTAIVVLGSGAVVAAIAYALYRWVL